MKKNLKNCKHTNLVESICICSIHANGLTFKKVHNKLGSLFIKPNQHTKNAQYFMLLIAIHDMKLSTERKTISQNQSKKIKFRQI